MLKTLNKNKIGDLLSVVLLDEQFQNKMGSGNLAGSEILMERGRIERKWQIFTSASSKALVGGKNVMLVLKASQLAEFSGFIREMNAKNYLKGLFIRPDIKTELLPKVMHESGVSTLKQTVILSHPETLWRVLNAWSLGAPEKLIADASAADGTLFVASCSFSFYRVRFKDLKSLRQVAPENHTVFNIDEDGSYIHWPEEDIHLDIDTLEYNTNEKYRKKADILKLQYHQHFGRFLKSLRKKAGLRQSDVPDLSARQIRRIENGETPVTVGALEKIAAALGLTIEGLLDKRASSEMVNK